MAQLLRRMVPDNRQPSIYSLVSSSELTPGSVDIWLDLPDAIKFDPVLEPFKQHYERNHGKLQNQQNGGDQTLLPNKFTGAVEKKEDPSEYLMTQLNNNGFADILDCDKENQTEIKNKYHTPLRFLKLFVLITFWVLITVALLLNVESSAVVLHTAVPKGENIAYQLESSQGAVRVLVSLTGPFLRGSDKDTGQILDLWLERSVESNGSIITQKSEKWNIRLQPEIEFAESASDSNTLVISNLLAYSHTDLDVAEKLEDASVTLHLSTNSNKTIPITVSYFLSPITQRDGVIYATVLLCILYVLIIFEVVNRTIAALISSSLGVAVLSMCGLKPSLPELVSWLDMETLLLLFSMMVLVAILAETGLFDYLAVCAFEITGGRTWPLINCLCFFTAFFSTFLDNVTTVLLMTPVTIRLCEVMKLNPVPVLMSMVIFSNVGGAATPVGDPPNVIIASHPMLIKEMINFATFTLHMGLGILLVCVQTWVQLRFMFRDMNKLRHSVPSDILELRQEIAVWKRAAASLANYSRDEDIVRKALEKKVERLSKALSKRKSGGKSSKKDPLFTQTLADMKMKYGIRDKQLLIKSTVCVSFVVAMFFLHAFPVLQRLSLGWTALLGAILLLLLAERDDLEPILARVEWSTLLFFAALFVFMEVLSKLGLIAWIGSLVQKLILNVSEESRLAVALMLVLWVSGLASAFVDNIPLTTMMIRVTTSLADPQGLALPLAPLAWALSFGACLGGNGTLIGASANVVCAGVAEQHGYRFTFLQFFKVGFPVMMGNLITASVYLLLCHCVGSWH